MSTTCTIAACKKKGERKKCPRYNQQGSYISNPCNVYTYISVGQHLQVVIREFEGLMSYCQVAIGHGLYNIVSEPNKKETERYSSTICTWWCHHDPCREAM